MATANIINGVGASTYNTSYGLLADARCVHRICTCAQAAVSVVAFAQCRLRCYRCTSPATCPCRPLLIRSLSCRRRRYESTCGDASPRRSGGRGWPNTAQMAAHRRFPVAVHAPDACQGRVGVCGHAWRALGSCRTACDRGEDSWRAVRVAVGCLWNASRGCTCKM